MRPIAEGLFTNEAFPRLIGRRIRCGGGLRRVYENVVPLRDAGGGRQAPGQPKTAYSHVYGAPGVSAVTILER